MPADIFLNAPQASFSPMPSPANAGMLPTAFGGLGNVPSEHDEALESRVNLGDLGSFIRNSFQTAVFHRNLIGLNERLLACQRQRSGIYDPDVEAEVKRRGGCQTYFNVTAPKCDGAVALITDAMNPAKERIYSLEPTPIPELPEEIQGQIEQRVDDVLAQMEMEMGMTIPSSVALRVKDMYVEEKRQEVVEEAQGKALVMERKIDDQMAEGGFLEAFVEFVQYLTTYPLGILKRSVAVKKLPKWSGKTIAEVEEPIPVWSAVNPQAFFPGPNVTKPNCGPLHELVNFEKRDLQAMKSQVGWNADEIDAVCADSSNSYSLEATIPGGQQRALAEGRNLLANSGIPEGSVQGVEFWGAVEGRMLTEWGYQLGEGEEPLNPNDWYEITAILIGSHVVKAVKNPNTLGHRPYYVTSWEKVPGSIWGRALPEKMSYCQHAYNAIQRAKINNMAHCAGFQIFTDLDSIDPCMIPKVNDVYPGKNWLYHSQEFNGSGAMKPVDLFQPKLITAELDEAAENFLRQADDVTGLQRVLQGNGNMPGAGQTASGTSMLLNQMTKLIKQVVLNIDNDVTRPSVTDQYYQNLAYLDAEEFEDAMGDCRVVARGAVAQITQEVTDQRRLDFLNLTNNPIDQAIMGNAGRGTLLRAVAAKLDLPVDKIIPPDDVLKQRMQQILAQPPQPQQLPPGAFPQTTPGYNTPATGAPPVAAPPLASASPMPMASPEPMPPSPAPLMGMGGPPLTNHISGNPINSLGQPMELNPNAPFA